MAKEEVKNNLMEEKVEKSEKETVKSDENSKNAFMKQTVEQFKNFIIQEEKLKDEVSTWATEKLWPFWHRIQARMFWVVILLLVGAGLGVWGSSWYFQSMMDDSIKLKGIIINTETRVKSDKDTNKFEVKKEKVIYDLIVRSGQ